MASSDIIEIDKITDKEIAALLDNAKAAWEQYKRGQGTLVTDADELDAFLDSL